MAEYNIAEDLHKKKTGVKTNFFLWQASHLPFLQSPTFFLAFLPGSPSPSPFTPATQANRSLECFNIAFGGWEGGAPKGSKGRTRVADDDESM